MEDVYDLLNSVVIETTNGDPFQQINDTTLDIVMFSFKTNLEFLFTSQTRKSQVLYEIFDAIFHKSRQ